MSATLFDKIWDQHVVDDLGDGVQLLHVDRHLMHELSGQRGLLEMKQRGIRMRDPGLTIGSMDHVVSTVPGAKGGNAPWADKMIESFRAQSRESGVKIYDIGQDGQGIVHVVGPELGFTLPGTTLLCGDSHTCTHGALGALAWGIGTSELTHVLATQTIVQQRPKTMRARFDGKPGRAVTAKDMILALIGKIGTAGGVGCAVEYAGEAIRGLDIEGRLTVCNLSIELGAKIGMIAPDEKTYAYLKGRRHAPKGALWDQALAHWKTLPSDAGAKFDIEHSIDCSLLAPQITWGTSPEDVIGVDGAIPGNKPEALAYMGLVAGKLIAGMKVDRVFIGSCTNSRLPDLRAAAEVVRGRKAAKHVKAWVVPGSWRIKQDAEAEGLHQVFLDAGFEWREAGCSMCVGVNGEQVEPLARCVSTSNRNFVGRQGPQARTHLASPAMAAAAAIAGEIVDVRSFSL
ncbi:MAG: 3-isopropylmalate dehydratase large subunit [Betaproteobacteria bacterium]|nr:3-isopropylmalate dehydratase large subunit [Betaproteobacteria bacterium]